MTEEIVRMLRALDDRVNQILVHVEGWPVLKLGLVDGVKVPLYAMGDGTARYLSILLAACGAEGNALFVDEIENGIHHSAMVDIWGNIADMARKWQVQVFATTHSGECLRSAHEAFSQQDEYDLAVYRLDRVGDDIKAVRYDRESIEVCLKMDVEMRG
jgi:AAA15 family ATPase/GTPase